jgi:serine/threonine protein phosphatase PrpC
LIAFQPFSTRPASVQLLPNNNLFWLAQITHATAVSGSRLILASDGVWDVITHEQAAKLIKGVKDPRRAARALCDAAKSGRLYGGHTTDDISAVVVNVGVGGKGSLRKLNGAKRSLIEVVA